MSLQNLKKQERRRNLYSFGGDVVEEDSMNTDQHLDVERYGTQLEINLWSVRAARL